MPTRAQIVVSTCATCASPVSRIRAARPHRGPRSTISQPRKSGFGRGHANDFSDALANEKTNSGNHVRNPEL